MIITAHGLSVLVGARILLCWDSEIDELKERNQSLRYESNQYQNKLIKEENKITLDDFLVHSRAA